MKRYFIWFSLLAAVSVARAEDLTPKELARPTVVVQSAPELEKKARQRAESERREKKLREDLAAVQSNLKQIKEEESAKQQQFELAAAVAVPQAPRLVTEYHFPISPTIADLRVGITAEQCRLILGNPRRINGTQWVYARGYIYMRDGKVEAMQNKAGGVFAAEWK